MACLDELFCGCNYEGIPENAEALKIEYLQSKKLFKFSFSVQFEGIDAIFTTDEWSVANADAMKHQCWLTKILFLNSF